MRDGIGETICSLLGTWTHVVVVLIASMSFRRDVRINQTDKLAHCYGRVNVWADLDLIGHIFQLETSSDIKKGILGRTENQTPQFG
jgi:hypothetical protein